MSEEFAHTLNDFVTLMTFYLMLTLKESILFFQVVFLFDKVENIVFRIGDMIRVTKDSGVKILALNNRNLI